MRPAEKAATDELRIGERKRAGVALLPEWMREQVAGGAGTVLTDQVVTWSGSTFTALHLMRFSLSGQYGFGSGCLS